MSEPRGGTSGCTLRGSGRVKATNRVSSEDRKKKSKKKPKIKIKPVKDRRRGTLPRPDPVKKPSCRLARGRSVLRMDGPIKQ